MQIDTHAANFVFDQLNDLLDQLDDEQYQAALPVFSGATIGKHVRHIIEFFSCVHQACSSGSISYDDRPRDEQLETQRWKARRHLEDLRQALARLEDRSLMLKGNLCPLDPLGSWEMGTSALREFYYAVEHAIHHMAIIKMGLLSAYPQVQIPEGFGVAPSTLRHERQVQLQ
ncbi:MAG: hypothetical protein RMK52_06980 [Chitinophagales bacterium]|nr:hypothetical protein [Chitinophagales bacterium]MDW8393973.1 hypothetical protein [Chitinophagales bacterium]